MRTLLVICAALVVVLGVVCASLWRELHADRQLIAGMRAAAQPAIEANTASEPHRRTEAFAQAEQQAKERVDIWSDRLEKAGHGLTMVQQQALATAASTELHREAEEFLALTVPPTKEAVANLQNDTNQRILRDVASQLTAEQIKMLRAQFAAGHEARLAAAHAEQERTANTGN